MTLDLFAASFAAPATLSESGAFAVAGSLLLFFGVLTLVNAPFDWLALGFTRALLRRGLELTSWWPVGLAVLDLVAALLGVGLLAAVMILSTQLFDHLAERGGGTPVLRLLPLLDGIRDHPENPEYYWVYVTLVTTLLPSLVNLALGTVSLLRGVPFLASWLLAQMPEAGAGKEWNRPLVAFVLTAHWAIGGLLAAVVWAGSLYALGVWLPMFADTDILAIARQLAEYDLPARLF